LDDYPTETDAQAVFTVLLAVLEESIKQGAVDREKMIDRLSEHVAYLPPERRNEGRGRYLDMAIRFLEAYQFDDKSEGGRKDR